VHPEVAEGTAIALSDSAMVGSIPAAMRVGIAIAGLLSAVSESAGQVPESTPAPPRVEIVAGGGFSGHTCCGEGAAAALLVTFNLTRRLSIEIGSDVTDLTDAFRGAYFTLGKFRFRRAPGPSWFLSFGAAGFYSRYDVPERRYAQPDDSMLVFPAYTYGGLERPEMGVAGVGYFHPLTGRVGARGECALMVGGINGFGAYIRLMGAAVVPIGRKGGT
jgi:hypothetical protein